MTIPAPTLNLQFALARFPDPRLTFTRSTTATYTNALGQIATAAANEPRFDYDPSTAECLGLLIEKSRANVLTHTLDMTLANAATSGGDVSDSSGDAHFDYFTSGIAFGAPSTTTFYYKQYTFASFTGVFSIFVVMDDASEPQIGSVSDAGIDFAMIVDGGVQTTGITKKDMGEGRWRVSIAVNDSSFNNGYFGVQARTTNSGKPFTVYGYQLESGGFATSYIPTTSAATTRATDVGTISGDDFTNFFNASEGTFLVTSSVLSAALTDATIFAVDDGTTTQNEQIDARTVGTSGIIYPRVRVGGSGVVQFEHSGLTTTDENTFAFGYKANDHASSCNGAAALTYSGGALPSAMTRMRLGVRGSISNQMSGHIHSLIYFPRRLTNAELVELSAA